MRPGRPGEDLLQGLGPTSLALAMLPQLDEVGAAASCSALVCAAACSTRPSSQRPRPGYASSISHFWARPGSPYRHRWPCLSCLRMYAA